MQKGDQSTQKERNSRISFSMGWGVLVVLFSAICIIASLIVSLRFFAGDTFATLQVDQQRQVWETEQVALTVAFQKIEYAFREKKRAVEAVAWEDRTALDSLLQDDAWVDLAIVDQDGGSLSRVEQKKAVDMTIFTGYQDMSVNHIRLGPLVQKGEQLMFSYVMRLDRVGEEGQYLWGIRDVSALFDLDTERFIFEDHTEQVLSHGDDRHVARMVLRDRQEELFDGYAFSMRLPIRLTRADDAPIGMFIPYIPERLLFAPVHQVYQLLDVFVIGIVLCALVGLFFLFHYVIYPLQQLTNKARRMMRRYAPKEQVRKYIGVRDVDHMIDYLHDQLQFCERIIDKQRTQEHEKQALYSDLLKRKETKTLVTHLFEGGMQSAKEVHDVRMAVLHLLQDLRQEKEKLAESKAKDEAMLQHIGDGLIAIDNEKHIMLMNPAAAQMLDCDLEASIGKKWYHVLRAVDEDGSRISSKDQVLTQAIAEQKTMKDNTVMYIKKNNVSFAASVTASPILLKDSVVGAILIFRDISKERAIDKAKTEFVSLASHQLRTPLATINWYAEMLFAGDAGKLNKEQNSYLEEIYVGSRRMVELVNALLNVSRIELDTFSVQPRMVDMSQVIDDVLREMAPDIQRKALHIVKQIASDLPIAKADPDLLQIIFQNIINNAVKYTDAKGDITVSLSLYDPEEKREDASKPLHILFTVADTGYGIPKDQQAHIFSKMFRADNVKQRDTVGTGLGLYIVKSIVEYFGGKIWFDSVEGKGTTFYIVLPILEIAKKRQRNYSS